MANQYWNKKVVLITGGSSGIGLALAKQLAAAGAHVWLTARRIELLEAALKEVQAARSDSSLNCGIVSADVSDSKQAARIIETVTRAVDTPDVLINSAGIDRPGYVHELTPDIFEHLMQVNYLGTAYVTGAVLPAMMKRGSGHIINLSSMAGYMGIFGYTAYGATKFAVAGYSEALRAEMKPRGIRVSVAFPPDTLTPGFADDQPFLPSETKALSGNAKALSADKVALSILRQAGKGSFLIFPGTDARFFYLISTKLPKSLVFSIMDMMAVPSKKAKKA